METVIGNTGGGGGGGAGGGMLKSQNAVGFVINEQVSTVWQSLEEGAGKRCSECGSRLNQIGQTITGLHWTLHSINSDWVTNGPGI